MRWIAAFVVVVLTAAPSAAEDLVYRVDSATAVISGKRMTITARGAVKTGGWDHPRLVLKKRGRDAGEVEFEFVATPPEDSAAVVQSLMPVSVRLKTRLPKRGVAAIRVNAGSNSVTAQIIAGRDARK